MNDGAELVSVSMVIPTLISLTIHSLELLLPHFTLHTHIWAQLSHYACPLIGLSASEGLVKSDNSWHGTGRCPCGPLAMPLK